MKPVNLSMYERRLDAESKAGELAKDQVNVCSAAIHDHMHFIRGLSYFLLSMEFPKALRYTDRGRR